MSQRERERVDEDKMSSKKEDMEERRREEEGKKEKRKWNVTSEWKQVNALKVSSQDSFLPLSLSTLFSFRVREKGMKRRYKTRDVNRKWKWIVMKGERQRGVEREKLENWKGESKRDKRGRSESANTWITLLNAVTFVLLLLLLFIPYAVSKRRKEKEQRG